MFPGPNAQVYYNEVGEPLGWDYPSEDDAYVDEDELDRRYWEDPRYICSVCDCHLEDHPEKSNDFFDHEFVPSEPPREDVLDLPCGEDAHLEAVYEDRFESDYPGGDL
jgi:hypothetical protein